MKPMKCMHTLSLLAVSVGTFALMACESVDSEDIKTSGMHATFTAKADGTDTALEAILRVGGETSTTYVALSDGDELAVTHGDETLTLSENHLGDYYYYTASVPTTGADERFVLSFTRAEEDSAPETVATLPAPMAFTSPAADTTFSRGTDAITVTWEPSGSTDDVNIDIAGECFVNVMENLSGDPGTYTFEAGDLESREADEDDTCVATVTLTKKRTGTLDAAFGEGGKVYGAQVRELSLRVDP